MGTRTLRGDLEKSLLAGSGEAVMVAAMGEAILASDRPDTEARRRALAIMAGALLMHANRLALDAFVLLRFRVCFRYARLDGILEGFVTDLLRASPDPAADVLRVQILALQILPDPSAAVTTAVAAMTQVATAGMTAVN
ncbi:MAG TPA: hypothetical protein VF867_04345 [Arthrobacter sp.]